MIIPIKGIINHQYLKETCIDPFETNINLQSIRKYCRTIKGHFNDESMDLGRNNKMTPKTNRQCFNLAIFKR